MAIAYGIMAVLIHIIVALAVNGDAKRLVSNRGELFYSAHFSGDGSSWLLVSLDLPCIG